MSRCRLRLLVSRCVVNYVTLLHGCIAATRSVILSSLLLFDDRGSHSSWATVTKLPLLETGNTAAIFVSPHALLFLFILF